MKLYIISNFGNGLEKGEGPYCLIGEDGKAWYGHYCSNIGFAKGDLIMNRPERQKELKEAYGEYEILYLGDDDMTNDELMKRYKEREEKVENNG